MSTESLHPPARPQIDEDLTLILYNEHELIARMDTLFQSTVISALSASLPQRIEAKKQDAKLLEQFLVKASEDIGRIRQHLRGLFGTSEAIANQIEQEVRNFFPRLAALDLQEKEAGSDPAVALAIRHAVDALRELVTNFTIQALGDEEQLRLLDTTPSDRELTVHSFLDVPEEKESELIFRKSEEDEALIAELMESHGKPIKTHETESDIAEFRWQWTDDELFLERQLPQMRQTRMEVSDIEPALVTFKEELLTGFATWKEQCNTVPKSSDTFVGKDGLQKSRDEMLDIMERTFRENIAPWSDYFRNLVSGCMLWQKIMEDNLPILQRRIETYFLFPQAPKPLCIRPALERFFNQYKKSDVVISPLLSEEHISQSSIFYFRPMTVGVVGDQVLEEALLSCTARDTEDLESTIRRFLRGKYQGDSVKKSNNKAAVKRAIVALSAELTECAQTRGRFEYQSAQKQAEFLKTMLGKALNIISQFTSAELTPALLADFRSAASFHVSWNFREMALTRPLLEGMDVSAPGYLQELAHFYPDPEVLDQPRIVSETEKDALQTLSADFLNTVSRAILDDAVDRLRLEKDGQESAVEDNIRSQLIVPAKEAELVAVNKKLQKNGLQTAEEAQRYIASLRAIVEVVPPTIDIDGQTLEVPAGFTEHLRSQLEELSTRIFSLCPAEALTTEEDAGGQVDFISDPLAGVFERARMRKASHTLADESAKILSKSQDALQEAMEVADIPSDRASRYVQRLMTTALEVAGTKILSGKITILNQPYIEDIHAEVVRLSVLCIDIIDQEISRVIVPGSIPSTEQLRTIVMQTIARAGEHATQDNDFLTKDDHHAFLHQAFSAFMEPTIHADDLLVEDMGVAESITSERDQEVVDATPVMSLFPRLDSAVQQFTEARDRGALRKEEQKRQVRLLGLPDTVRYIEEQEAALSATIEMIIGKAGTGDIHALETLQETADHLQLLRQLLALRMSSSH